MPGMMDTVLNVGMTDGVAEALARATGDARFAWDTHRRLVQSYATIVLGAPSDLVRSRSLDCLGPDDGAALDARPLEAAAHDLRTWLEADGFTIPGEPVQQVVGAVRAVFASWGSERARAYRTVEGIDESLGTAATIQMMTFGNLGPTSGTGVAFSRDPSTGAKVLVGDFLFGAQGEEVVAGSRATLPLSELRVRWPDIAQQLESIAIRLEHDLGDLVDIEFTVEQGTLWLLQVRRGKRSSTAALRVAIDMADDPGFSLDRRGALAAVADVMADPPTLAHPEHIEDPGAVIARGLAASPGRAAGPLCTDIDEAIAAGARGARVVLVREETSPADIAGIAEACALVTTRGGLVSHAALIARSWGVPAVVGAADVTVEADGIVVLGQRYAAGATVTVDGEHGAVLLGDHPAAEVEPEEVAILRRWARELEPEPPGATDAVLSGCIEAATRESCERVLALKGAATVGVVAEVLGAPLDDVREVVGDLLAAGVAQTVPGDRVRLVPTAIAAVDARYTALVPRLRPVIESLWDRFHAADVELKRVVSDWQTREVDGEAIPNDHADAGYDAQVLRRLRVDVHPAIAPVIEAVAGQQRRFDRYQDRLDGAVRAVEAGDVQMMAHPLRDSYHTVWFELHEELIRLSGRTRAEEAAAGRA
jgi:pyruvate,orthophosphate dikinase